MAQHGANGLVKCTYFLSWGKAVIREQSYKINVENKILEETKVEDKQRI